MKTKVIRAFVTARSFIQGLVISGEVVRKVSQVSTRVCVCVCQLKNRRESSWPRLSFVSRRRCFFPLCACVCVYTCLACVCMLGMDVRKQGTFLMNALASHPNCQEKCPHPGRRKSRDHQNKCHNPPPEIICLLEAWQQTCQLMGVTTLFLAPDVFSPHGFVQQALYFIWWQHSSVLLHSLCFVSSMSMLNCTVMIFFGSDPQYNMVMSVLMMLDHIPLYTWHLNALPSVTPVVSCKPGADSYDVLKLCNHLKTKTKQK